MPILKFSRVGDARGALLVERARTVPTYGEQITIDDGHYEIVGLTRYPTRKRADAVRIDVRPIEDGKQTIV